ncbi:unnamed protein product [Lampetra planeri]
MPRAKHGEKRLVALVRELDIVLPIAAGNGDYVLEGGPENSGPRGLPALAQGVGLAVAGGGTWWVRCVAGGHVGEGPRRWGWQPGQPPPPRGPTAECLKCGRPGHIANECRSVGRMPAAPPMPSDPPATYSQVPQDPSL